MDEQIPTFLKKELSSTAPIIFMRVTKKNVTHIRFAPNNGDKLLSSMFINRLNEILC
jgi:hypothetical protein